MQRKIAQGGAFWVSIARTKESKNIGFFYGWQAAIPETAEAIVAKYPNYFEIPTEQEL